MIFRAKAVLLETFKPPQMTFRAKPILVEAFEIVSIAAATEDGGLLLVLLNHPAVTAPPAMLARYKPVAGDYYVIQDDGYAYINPGAVFLRKYEPVSA